MQAALLRQTTLRPAHRAFSTSAKVHPNILPFIQTRRSAARWVTPIVGVVAAAYVANNYRQGVMARRAAEAERQARESRQRASQLLDAYGDGTSIDSLERAVAVYESQNRS